MYNYKVKFKKGIVETSVAKYCLRTALIAICCSSTSYAASADLTFTGDEKTTAVMRMAETKEPDMLDHMTLSIRDYNRSIDYYDKTLSILGYKRLRDIDYPGLQLSGYGKSKTAFWIGTHGDGAEDIGKARGFHVAFGATSAKAVQEWYAKCLELGGTDNGAPGVRAHYHPGYYAAFIIDPDGWRTEAVFHEYRSE